VGAEIVRRYALSAHSRRKATRAPARGALHDSSTVAPRSVSPRLALVHSCSDGAMRARVLARRFGFLALRRFLLGLNLLRFRCLLLHHQRFRLRRAPAAGVVDGAHGRGPVHRVEERLAVALTDVGSKRVVALAPDGAGTRVGREEGGAVGTQAVLCSSAQRRFEQSAIAARSLRGGEADIGGIDETDGGP